MKVALVLFALASVAFSAPQQRKDFHEHVEDFLDLILDTVGQDLEDLMAEYQEFEEFESAFNYMRTANFKNLVYEMESLPEFEAVIEFLEQDNIDVHYFLDLFNDIMENAPAKKNARQERISGRDFNSFVRDCIDLFPKSQLAALYDQKMADDAEFSEAMTNLLSDEWYEIYTALWNSATFQAEVQALSDNGIDIGVLLYELLAIFGQN